MEKTSNQPRLLLVDDHQDTLTLQAILLRREGFDVVTSGDAETALAQAAEGKVDLVVSDLRLPDRDGVELMQELHKRYGLYGVALTGAADAGRAADRVDAGFVEVLIKPVAPEQLVKVIRHALSEVDNASSQ
ncbi:response regulator [Phycisphaerales bacterium AB-hyl4]|uniref:Response regulator n=1 Tax=Natronomicrosphaera hydrolytica TaxID=3242702 RepID=A0ABV4U9S6_9BACT